MSCHYAVAKLDKNPHYYAQPAKKKGHDIAFSNKITNFVPK